MKEDKDISQRTYVNSPWTENSVGMAKGRGEGWEKGGKWLSGWVEVGSREKWRPSIIVSIIKYTYI